MLKTHQIVYNEKGHLLIGGIDTVELAKKYGTPLIVYDVEKIRENARAFLSSFARLGIKGKVAYASKAFSSLAIVQVMQEEGLHLDVVSLGELHTALVAGFPPEKIQLHGNNKSVEEIELAIKNNIGCIVVDNFHDIELIEKTVEKHSRKIDVLIRVTPGISASTHQYIDTGAEDSKFGFHMNSGQADEAFALLLNHPSIRLKGIHFHIGSQIFNVGEYIDSLEIVMEKIQEWNLKTNYLPEVINVGGGFGIRYTDEDSPVERSVFIEQIAKSLKNLSEKIGIPLPELWIEPGRSIVGDAAVTLYEIGSIKHIPGIRKYVSINGGMTDNIRPALYDANYEGVIANKAKEQPKEIVTIAGKCCESGDILVRDIQLCEVESGDILAIFATGAYGYSMASHYNRLPKPAVVFVEEGKDQLVIRRETVDDVIKNDLFYHK